MKVCKTASSYVAGTEEKRSFSSFIFSSYAFRDRSNRCTPTRFQPIKFIDKMAAEVDPANGAKQVEVPCSSKRYRHGRFLKQGYHKSERSDARREAARLFLSGITLDKNRSFNVLTPRSQLPTVALTQEEALSSAGNPLGGTMEGNTPLKSDQLQFQSTSNSPFFLESASAIPLSGVQAQDRSIESPRLGKRRKSFKKKLSFEALSEAALPGTRSLAVLRDYSRDPANRRYATISSLPYASGAMDCRYFFSVGW